MASISHPQVRAAVLKDYVAVAHSIGVDPQFLLRRAGIDESLLHDGERKVSAAAVARLYDGTAAAAGRADFGLLMAERRDLASLGPLGLLLRYQPTVRAAAERAFANMRLHNELVNAHIEDDGQVALIRFEFLPGLASRQIVEAGVAIGCLLLREVTGGAWLPERVHFRHAAPESQATHTRVLGCPIAFDSEFDGIVCSTSALEIANPRGDVEMAAHAQRFIDMLSRQQPAETATGLSRMAICRLIGEGEATIERVAEHLGMHPRSLQRLLNQEGTSFGELLVEIRRELALRYLGESKRPVTEIAMLLGYATISSFTRWFSDFFGKSPVAWRKAAEEGMPIAPLAPRIAAPANDMCAGRRAAAPGQHAAA